MPESGPVAQPPPPERAFIGLDRYVETDAAWFAGRTDAVERVAGLVQDYPFVLLTGHVGVGKTSLICAGLLPHWQALGWQAVYLPLPPPQAPLHERDLLHRLVGESPPPDATFTSACERLAERHAPATTVIAFDGFERLARCDDPELADSLYRALEGMVGGRWPNLRALITYRGDAEADVGPPLQRIVGLAGGPPRFYLLPFSVADAREILQASFAAVGVSLVDEGLLDAILDELAAASSAGHGAGGVLPAHLQMLGQTLCQAARDADGRLTVARYEELGGVPALLGDYLTRQLERFGERRGDVEKLLVAVVRRGRLSERQLQDASGLQAELSPEDWSALLTDLAGAHLIRLAEDPLGVHQIELVHPLLADMIESETISQERELRRLRGTLALRAAALEQGPVVMRSDLMAELYQWRDRILPSPTELRLLLFNGLMGRGPAWYWLRQVPVMGIRGFLAQAYGSPLPALRRGGGLALAAAAGVEQALALQELLGEQDPAVREAAANGLVQIIPDLGWDDALLLRLLIDAPHPAVQSAAAEGLARVLAQVGPEILPALPELLRDDDEQVRAIAERTLAQVATRAHLPQLRHMLQDEDLNVLNAAWTVLAEVLVRTPTDELDGLQAMLTDPDPYVQGAAGEALTRIVARLGPQDRPLLRQLSQVDDPNVRREATLALVRTLRAPDDGLPLPERLDALRAGLRPLLKDWDAAVRHAAGRALAEGLARVAQAEMPDKAEVQEEEGASNAAADAAAAAMAELRAMMDSADRPVRVAFAQATTGLLARRGRGAVPELRRLLDDADPDVRQAAREALEAALAQVGREAIPDLRALLDDANWDVWQVAGLALARVLSELGRPGLRDLRLLLKEGEDPEVRRAGGRALASVLRGLGRVALPELHRMLEDEDLVVRRAGGRVLADVLRDMGPRGIPELCGLLENLDEEIRQAASQALHDATANMGQEGLSVLRDLLADERLPVRTAARDALQAIAGQLGRLALPFLREMLNDRARAARYAAAAAIAGVDPSQGLQAWAQLVVAYPLDNAPGQAGAVAIQELVDLDRRLYCPFAEAWESRVGGAETVADADQLPSMDAVALSLTSPDRPANRNRSAKPRRNL